MDSLDWTELNKNIKVTFTKKKYFNEYNYKLTYHVPGARLLSHKCTNDYDIMNRVNIHNNRHNHFTYSNMIPSWSQSRYFREKADFDQLKTFAEVYNNKSTGVKFRIEQDILNIYSNSETYLHRLANLVLGSYKSDAMEFCKPESANAQAMLDQGYTIVKKPPSHPYRVRLKEGFQHLGERQGLAMYLKNLKDDVKITTFMLDRLTSTYKYFTGGYIYVKDPKIVSLLIMVSPNLIGTVNQMVINN